MTASRHVTYLGAPGRDPEHDSFPIPGFDQPFRAGQKVHVNEHHARKFGERVSGEPWTLDDLLDYLFLYPNGVYARQEKRRLFAVEGMKDERVGKRAAPVGNVHDAEPIPSAVFTPSATPTTSATTARGTHTTAKPTASGKPKPSRPTRST